MMFAAAAFVVAAFAAPVALPYIIKKIDAPHF